MIESIPQSIFFLSKTIIERLDKQVWKMRKLRKIS